MALDKIEILKQLKSEINRTLYFFVDTDLAIYGHIKPETQKAFKTQGVEFPEDLKEFVR